uniref:FIIND domain-containing protein n=1 Tax=Pavo cristatus TaxID=9049 RepID=A0A8C9EQ29_PAVCR
ITHQGFRHRVAQRGSRVSFFKILLDLGLGKMLWVALQEGLDQIIQSWNNVVWKRPLRSSTELKFLVRMATTVEYEYSFWESHLPAGIPSEWMEAGPLFDIRAEPHAVEAIHLPHFLCLSEGKLSRSGMRIGHVVDGNLHLEKPDAVRPFHAVLRDPSFSPMGVILLSASFPFIPVHSLVLLYRVIRAADITLHLYLIPNNHGLEKVSTALISHSVLWFPKWPPVNSQKMGVSMKRLDSRQLYTEIYSKDLQEGMQLTLTKVSQEGKMEHSSLWTTFLRAGREDTMQLQVW